MPTYDKRLKKMHQEFFGTWENWGCSDADYLLEQLREFCWECDDAGFAAYCGLSLAIDSMEKNGEPEKVALLALKEVRRLGRYYLSNINDPKAKVVWEKIIRILEPMHSILGIA